MTTTFDAIYHDIVPRERIVYTYEMRLDERKISVSLATLQIKPAGRRGRHESSWSTSRARSSTATTTQARASAGRASFWTSSERRFSAPEAPHSSFEALRSSQPRYFNFPAGAEPDARAAAEFGNEHDAGRFERGLHLGDRPGRDVVRGAGLEIFNGGEREVRRPRRVWSATSRSRPVRL